MTAGTSLTEGWTLSPADSDRDGPPVRLPAGIPATVPGCVHTDLLAAGLIPDPFLDRNETAVDWVSRTDWTYRTTLTPGQLAGADGEADTPRYERTDLVFDGLDTAAAIEFDGHHLGRTRNMHRAYRFDLTPLLPPPGATAELAVRFTSAYTEGEAVRELLGGPLPNAYHPQPFTHIRKMACSFGWDWGPVLPTAGIWRPARIERWSTARLARVRPLVTLDEGAGRVELLADLERSAAGADRPLTVRARIGEHHAEAAVPPGVSTARVVVSVPEPRLWWPRGYGEQPLHSCELTLHQDGAADGAPPLDAWSRRIGFRSIALDTSPDPAPDPDEAAAPVGSAFTLVVNGEPVFARGVNWIPDDVFPSRVTRDRYRARLAQAAEAGVDLVRVWGGGIYESEDFYDACDELGLMVWQDFPFACAAYPEEEPIRGEVAAEARQNVVRLMPHPSLVLWNGNNENLWGWQDWGWQEQLAPGQTWGAGYYLDLLPRIVADLDPTRPYWPGSPWSGDPGRHPNDPAYGTTHSWQVWNSDDYTAYADHRDGAPRFVAEFGWQAPPQLATLRRSLTDRPLAADSPGMRHHQKAEDGEGKLARGLERHFTPPPPGPDGFDRWHYLTQLNQVRAIAAGVEYWRSHWPRCAGTVLWQLNDCWPVTSWSAVDGDGRPKPLHRELARLYADRLLTFQLRAGRPVLIAVNQSAEPWSGTARVRLCRAEGAMLTRARLPFTAPPRGHAVLPLPPELAQPADPVREFLVADADGLRALRFDRPDREFAYPPAAMDVRIDADGNTNGDAAAEVTVTARSLLRDLLLAPDRLHADARCAAPPRTLLPGESTTLRVTGLPAVPTPTAVTAALFTVN
jgi:beta-mannosidase